MNIFQRLNEVRKAVAYLQKDKQVQGKGYMAITHDAVTAAVREHLITHGVMLIPSLVRSAMINTGTTTAKGIPFMRYDATYKLSFVNCDEPTDRVEMEIEAHALDDGDKAPGKAMSYATKYAYLKLLSIETGENEEAREPAKPALRVDRESHAPAKIAAAMFADSRTPEEVRKLEIIANAMREKIDEGDDIGAYSLVEANKLDADAQVALWSMLNAGERGKLKKAGQYIKAQKEQAPAGLDLYLSQMRAAKDQAERDAIIGNAQLSAEDYEKLESVWLELRK